MTLWRQRNAAFHGTDSAITLEKWWTAAVTKATAVYLDTIGNVLPSDGLILHRACINVILTWTKQHLDAYLATAEMICEQNVEPGWLLISLGCSAVCIVGQESYGMQD
jgi:hypothetical protein